MRHFLYRFILSVSLLAWLAGCAGSGAYWIPPSSRLPQAPAGAGNLPPTQPAANPPPATAGPASDPPGQARLTQAPPTNPPLEATLAASPTATLPPTPFSVVTFAPPATSTPTPLVNVVDSSPILYYAQAGDALKVVAKRFGVTAAEITSPEPLPDNAFIDPGQLLIIPRRLANTTISEQILPDSEVVYSPSAVDFDAQAFVAQSAGYLNSYSEWHKSTGMQSGISVLMRVATENSVNPRLLLALLEYHSHWVYNRPESQAQSDYPLGLNLPSTKGLYNQLIWTVNQLSIGYYAYREGRLTEVRFQDGVTARLAPDLNAGTAALQYYFAQLYTSQQWVDTLNPKVGFPALFTSMFGNPWERARTVEPLFPPGITQPALVLPFTRNWTWSYTGGPHGAWEQDGAYAALDFAPGSTEAGCTDTPVFATAAAAGLVVRTGPGLVVLDLDGDGHEQTGWVLIYLHLAEKGRVLLGAWVAQGDPLGHPSCEGGFATGTHIHIARKFNGEWVPADGPLAFNLGGWIAHAGAEAYKGTLSRGDVTLTACTCSNYLTFITRTDDDP